MDSDQLLVVALERHPSASVDSTTSPARERERRWILMSRAEQVNEMVSRWHRVPANQANVQTSAAAEAAKDSRTCMQASGTVCPRTRRQSGSSETV